jgi:Flp pilus assembly protein TadB
MKIIQNSSFSRVRLVITILFVAGLAVMYIMYIHNFTGLVFYLTVLVVAYLCFLLSFSDKRKNQFDRL